MIAHHPVPKITPKCGGKKQKKKPNSADLQFKAGVALILLKGKSTATVNRDPSVLHQ